MMPAAAVIHCTSPGPIRPPLPVESRCSTSPSIDDRHGLEPAVRMLADTARPLGGCEFGRAGMVEQQERAQLGAARVVRKQAAHREPVTHPVTFGTAVN